MKNKIINLLYRSGAGGEFFGSLLVSHEEIATKDYKYHKGLERWYLERDDWASQRPEVVRAENPRLGVSAGRKTTWHEELWNLRLDHGFGFVKWTDFWIDYLWNEWKETKTIIFHSRTKESLKYTQTLATAKLGFGENDVDAREGRDMMIDGIFDFEQFWKRPWESNALYFELFMNMIPNDHDFILIDPYELLHYDEQNTERCLKEIINYLEIDNFLFDEWCVKIKTYRMKNRKLINNPMGWAVPPIRT